MNTLESNTTAAELDRRIGQTYGKYTLKAKVADGAMGRVYEASVLEGELQGKRIAVKVLHDEVAKDAVQVERFRREFETARDIGSPYIVRVFEFGETGDGSSYLAMEFLEGEELGTLIRRGGDDGQGHLSVARALRMISQMSLGLEDAHSFGVIHRDLKPDNLFLCRGQNGDEVRLLDFGSVKLQMEMGPKLTAFGTTLGSPFYMSPEQAMGRADVDNRTDIFAFAAICYETLTGKIAFDDENVAQILLKIINGAPVPASQIRAGIPQSFDDVIDRGLAKDKTRRPPNATDLARLVIEAFGLSVKPGREGIEAWATAGLREWEAALGNAKPKEAKPFGKESTFPVAASTRDSDAPLAPISSRAGAPKLLLWTGLALLIGAGLLWFLNR